jgi:hypothetical protein
MPTRKLILIKRWFGFPTPSAGQGAAATGMYRAAEIQQLQIDTMEEMSRRGRG